MGSERQEENHNRALGRERPGQERIKESLDRMMFDHNGSEGMSRRIGERVVRGRE